MNRLSPLIVMMLLGAGCDEVDPGTAVGNPGKIGFGADDPLDGASLSRAEAYIVEVRAAKCDGILTERVIVDEVFDLLEPTASLIAIAGGSYCTLDVELDTELPISLEGTTASGTAFDVVLDPGIVRFDADFLIDGNELLIEFPVAASLPAEEIDALGPDSSIDKEDPIASRWADDIGVSSSLRDGTGFIGTSGDATSDTGNSAADLGAGCGCTSSSGSGSLGGLLLIVLATLRRGGRRRSTRQSTPSS